MATSSVTSPPIVPIEGTPSRPVVWWACIGVLFFALQLYVWIAWVTSDLFTPTLVGDSAVPTFVVGFARFWELVAVLLGLGALGLIIKSYVKDARLSALAVFIAAWGTTIWQDPFINFLRPMFSYSSVFFNYGSWAPFIPGWISPNASAMPEPLFMLVGMYTVFCVFFSLCVCWTMRWAKNRWPTIGVLQLILVGCLAGVIYDLILEFFWLRMQLYSYIGAIHEATLFADNIWQMPLYNHLVWGFLGIGVAGSLFYFRDDKGHMFAERGAETFTSKTGNAFMRIFAVGGFINVSFLTYSVIIAISVLWNDPYPETSPSWLINGLCGPNSAYVEVPCPTHETPIPMPHSGPALPATGPDGSGYPFQ